MDFKRRMEFLIRKQWNKKVNNASDAHFRAQELERLQNMKKE